MSSCASRPGGQPATAFVRSSGSGLAGCQSMSIRRPRCPGTTAFASRVRSPCLSFDRFLTCLGARRAGVGASGAGVSFVRGRTSCTGFEAGSSSPFWARVPPHNMRGWTKYTTPRPRASSRVTWPAAASDLIAIWTARSFSPVLSQIRRMPGQHLPVPSSACHARRCATSCSVLVRSISQNMSCRRRLTRRPSGRRGPCRRQLPSTGTSSRRADAPDRAAPG